MNALKAYGGREKFIFSAGTMKCHNCSSQLKQVITDLPFKTGDQSIVIVKQLPVLQCENCSEYLIEGAVMERVEILLPKASAGAELEVVRFAA